MKKILEWLLDGYGMTLVTRMLVDQKILPIGKKGRWAKSYINVIAHNRELIGEFQPHVRKDGKRVPTDEPISGYYPAVISEAEFDRLQLILKARRRQTGPTGKCVMNLFTGLVRHGPDGESMILCRSISRGKDYYYLSSSSGVEYARVAG